MKMNLTKLFFLSFMMIGVMLCLCSNNWLFIWCGLELSLISFLPMIHSKMVISSESAMKYFLVQSVSSSVLVLGIMGMVLMMVKYDLIILFSILMKMGVAPFHLWLLSVVEGLEMLTMILMFTLSSVAPLMMLTLVSFSISLVILLTLTIGATLGLNQNSNRKIITYSSIFNMGLILVSIKNNFVWIYYLIFYSILISSLIFIMFKMNMFYVNQMILTEINPSNKMIMWVTLLSMGGMPPFLGFSIKLIAIEFAINNHMTFNLVMVILFSLLVMFFYLRMTYLSLMFFCTSSKWTLVKMDSMSFIFLIMNVLTLPAILTSKIFN